MLFEQLYPSKFIEAADLKGQDRTLAISAVRLEELDGIKGKQWKAVITFAGAKKEWVCNRTNGEALKLMFGRETDTWLGKRVTLFPTETEVGGEATPCIRVRGSPDIDKAMSAEVKRGKKVLKIKVLPTGKRSAAPPAKPAGTAPTGTAPAAPPTTLAAEAPLPAEDPPEGLPSEPEPGAEG